MPDVLRFGESRELWSDRSHPEFLRNRDSHQHGGQMKMNRLCVEPVLRPARFLGYAATPDYGRISIICDFGLSARDCQPETVLGHFPDAGLK